MRTFVHFYSKARGAHLYKVCPDFVDEKEIYYYAAFLGATFRRRIGTPLHSAQHGSLRSAATTPNDSPNKKHHQRGHTAPTMKDHKESGTRRQRD